MDLYSLVIGNKWILEVFYAFIISLICVIIVVKTDKVYKISLHQGIRYFRNAFFFYGIAFVVRYAFGIFSDFSIDYYYILKVMFEYLIVMAGFFLLYSLLWKKVESAKEDYLSSLFNAKIAIFHVMALVIALLDFLWQTYQFMFLSQILIFIYALEISFYNYKNYGRQHKFLKFYLIAMLLSLAAWVLNALAAAFFEWNPGILIDVGVINIMFFLLFLYGVIKFTQK